MMMWFGGMGRCQCTCESHKLVPTFSAYPTPPLPLSSCLKTREFVEATLKACWPGHTANETLLKMRTEARFSD